MFFVFACEIVGVQPTKKNSARRIASRTAHPLHRGAESRTNPVGTGVLDGPHSWHIYLCLPCVKGGAAERRRRDCYKSTEQPLRRRRDVFRFRLRNRRCSADEEKLRETHSVSYSSPLAQGSHIPHIRVFHFSTAFSTLHFHKKLPILRHFPAFSTRKTSTFPHLLCITLWKSTEKGIIQHE